MNMAMQYVLQLNLYMFSGTSLQLCLIRQHFFLKAFFFSIDIEANHNLSM